MRVLGLNENELQNQVTDWKAQVSTPNSCSGSEATEVTAEIVARKKVEKEEAALEAEWMKVGS